MAIPKSEIQHCPSELTITDFDDMSRCATEAIWSDPRTSRCKNFTPKKISYNTFHATKDESIGTNLESKWK